MNGETESVLTTKPAASTTATKDSEAGTYDITVSGGAADNYSFSYVKGKLTIKAKTPKTGGVVSTVCSDVSDDSFRLFLTPYRDYLNKS